jgi:hypothetical protein
MAKLNTEDPRITYSRVTVKIKGKEYLAKSIAYEDSMAFGEIEGNSQMSLGTSDGMYSTSEQQIDFYADEFAEIMDDFGDGFYDERFEVTCAYEKSGDSKLTIDTLVACRWTKRMATNTGSDALTRSLSYKPHYIKWNGKNPLKRMPTGAK